MPEEILQPLSRAIISGSVWISGLRLLIIVFSTLRLFVFARLLAPVDFGIVGVAMLTVATLEALSQTGVQQALVQKNEKLDGFLDTAWTILVIRGGALFFMMYGCAPAVSRFFAVPDAISVIRFLGLTILFAGFNNIGIIYFQKELKFQQQFIFQIGGVLTDITVSIILAFLLRNAWAIVWGIVCGSFVSLILSYLLHPYRPRMSMQLSKASDMFTYGRWISFSSIVVYFGMFLDSIAVGKLLGDVALGIYRMSNQIAGIFATELKNVVGMVAFPAYSKIQYEKKKMKHLFAKVLSNVSFVAFPISAGTIVTVDVFTSVFLGSKWLPIVPIVQVLAVSAVLRVIFATGAPLFTGCGKPKTEFRCQVVRSCVLASTIYPLTLYFGTTGAAIAVFISLVFMSVYWFYSIKTIIGTTFREFFKTISIPLFSSIGMAVIGWICFNIFRPKSYDLSVAIFTITVVVVTCICFYIGLTILLLHLSGRSDILRNAKNLIKIIRDY